MKKVIVVTTGLLVSLTTIAQTRIGVKGAWNYASAKAVYTDVKQLTAYTNGYGAGIMGDIPFDGILHFAPSIMINKRGFIIKGPAGSTNKKEEYNITYIDLIPALSANFESLDNTISISVGPVIGFTNFGKVKTTNSTGVTSNQKMEFGFGAYGWFDLGVKSSMGLRINNFLIEAGYYAGLANINNLAETDGRNMQHRGISVSIGWFFKEFSQ